MVLRRRLLILALALGAGACSSDKSTGPHPPTLTIAPRNAIAAGDNFTCVLNGQGAAQCWGANDVGQLGGGTTASSAGLTAVSGGHRFTQIAATTSTACAVADDGSAWCWGANRGNLGNGDTTASSVPVAVSGGLHFQMLGGSGFAFCGLTTAGTVYCWGANTEGQLGNGVTSTTRSLAPVPVIGGPSFAGLTSALWASCGITSSGSAYCWGANTMQQLGVGSTAPAVTTPTPIVGGLSFSDMKLGSVTSCGIAAGTTYCWGTNLFGSAGNGNVSSPPVTQPTPIVGAPAFVSVFPGGGNDIFTPMCALTGDGTAYCWGANHSGELGTAAAPASCSFDNAGQTETFGCSGTAIAVSGGYMYKALAVGGEHVCGITTGGQVACWGRNDRGQLGGATTASTSSTPVLVAGAQAP